MPVTGAKRATTSKTTAVPIFKLSGKNYLLTWKNKDLGTCVPSIAGDDFKTAMGIVNNALRAYHVTK